EAHVDPARGAHELPGDVERVRGIAAGDGAPGVAFELVATADFQVALDGQKPASEPLWRGERVPQVLDRRVVAADRYGHDRWFTEVLTAVVSAKVRSINLRHRRPPGECRCLNIRGC